MNDVVMVSLLVFVFLFSISALTAVVVMAYRLSRDAMLAGAPQPLGGEEVEGVRVLMSDLDIAQALSARELHALMVTAVDDVLSDAEMADDDRADLLATLTDIAEAYGRGLVLQEKNKRH